MDKLIKLIEDSLIEEVKTSPKPGLVDLEDNGAQTNMDFLTFEISAKTITPYFYSMFEVGKKEDMSLKSKFLKIRKIGLVAELEMLKATNGVNTHKGIIFSLGVLICCAGVSIKEKSKFDVEFILKTAKEMTYDVIESDFEKIDRKNPKTSGEKLYVKYNDKGIRGEVQNAFPNIREYALPELKKLRLEYDDSNAVNLQVLLFLMSKIRDSSVLSNGAEEDLKYLMSESDKLYKEKSPFTSQGIKKIKELNEECKKRKIIPSVSASLLAITIFLSDLENLNNDL